MIKKIFFYILVFFGFSLFCYVGLAASGEATAHLDKIVAVVNGDVITQSELNRRIALFKEQRNATEPKDSIVRKQALDSLVDDLLQLQLAQRSGIQVSVAEVDHAISTIAKNNRLTLERLKSSLQEHGGLSFKKYREQIRDQILVSRVRTPLFREIQVSEAEVAAVLQSPPKIKSTFTQYHVADVLIETPDVVSSSQIEAAKKIAIKIAVDLRKDADIGQVAQGYEASGQQVHKNDLAWRTIDELPTLFSKEISGMNVGQVTNPIQAPNGFHVIKLLETRGGTQTKLTKEQARELVYSRKLGSLLKPWLKDLRAAAYVKITD